MGHRHRLQRRAEQKGKWGLMDTAAHGCFAKQRTQVDAESRALTPGERAAARQHRELIYIMCATGLHARGI